MMGGEHSLSIGCVGACTDVFEDVGVIMLDAHLDMRKSYEGLNKGHASTSYQILKLIPKNRYAVVGVRSGSREEFEFVRRAGIKFVTSSTIKNEGIEQALGEIFEGLEGAGCKHLYISIDADVVDPAYVPGVGNPEPFGLSPWDIEYVIKEARKMAVGLDVVELIPHYDFSQGAILFSKLIREFIAYVARGF
ncbi:hypothetical protein DRN72_02525 [Methanosarcinales archaeon]|nr:MAG: hypothetical protein DRN72_02525 [Methanosarcinales archaeon]